MAKIKRSEFDRLEPRPKNWKYIKFFEKLLWPNGEPISPYDSTAKVWKLKDGWYMCSKTRKKFNVRTGSKELKHSNIPLRIWYLALCFLSSNRGTSCRKLGRFLGITYKSAWLLQKDVRNVLKQSNFVKEKLENYSQIDEMLVGGSNPNRHWDKKVPNCQGRSCEDKTLVLGILGNYLVTRVLPDSKLSTTIEPIIVECIEKGATVDTDEFYRHSNLLSKRYNHRMVNHSAKPKQYKNGETTTNSIEGVWSFFKANIKGIHRNNISDKYLQNYMDELTFYFNTREWSEQDRIELLALSLLGKPLTYDEFKQSKYEQSKQI